MHARSLTLIVAILISACGGSDDGPGGGGGQAGSAGAAGSAGSTGGSAGSAGQGGSAGTAGTAGSSGAGGAPGVPGVRILGRSIEPNPGEAKFAWSGSGILFRFQGTSASVSLDDKAQFFTVLVDGVEQPRLATSGGPQSYGIVSGLPEGEHQVELYRRTEASFGATSFLGVELNGGTLLPPPPAAARRLEVIGDSITAGYGNEGTSATCNFSADTENHYITYEAIAARNLGAELVTVAWSGKGVIYNYGDDKTDPLPTVYDRVFAYDAATKWDFSWQPHAVVIHLGTNDFSTSGDPSETEFVGAYVDFLTALRGYYPSARILAMVPIFLGGSDKTTARDYIQKAVANRKGSGDANLAVIEPDVTNDGWGCDYHPSSKTHASLAQSLTAELKTQMGW